ncbi:MAG: hypothetical protein GF313_04770 [Caldithrix sp.]|nr:hypothetical protein [Caldithrix sp.]
MDKIFRFLTTGLIVVVLVACSSTDDQENQMPADSSLTHQKDSMRTNIEQEVPVPNWFENVPQKDGFIYAVGTARSIRGEIAQRKATMQARIQLAEKYSALQNPAHTESGGASANELNVQLPIHEVKEIEKYKSDKFWQVYVLLEMQTAK